MGKKVRIGERLEVVFAPAIWGVQTESPINGRPAYAIDSCPTPQPGDRWEVMVVGMNPDHTAYDVEPINLVHAADGLGDLLMPHAPFYHEYIRQTEGDFAILLSCIGDGNADEEVAVLEEILDSCLLPETYRASVRSRFDACRASPAAA